MVKLSNFPFLFPPTICLLHFFILCQQLFQKLISPYLKMGECNSFADINKHMFRNDGLSIYSVFPIFLFATSNEPFPF